MGEPDSSQELAMNRNQASSPEQVALGVRILFGSIIGAAALAALLWEIFH